MLNEARIQYLLGHKSVSRSLKSSSQADSMRTEAYASRMQQTTDLQPKTVNDPCITIAIITSSSNKSLLLLVVVHILNIQIKYDISQ
jgi:hypothetical protein